MTKRTVSLGTTVDPIEAAQMASDATGRNISPDVVRDALNSGKLKGNLYNGRWFIERRDLKAWADGRKRP